MPASVLLRAGFLEYKFNSLSNLKFKGRTKAVAFADDLMLAVRGDSASAVENYSNGELSKITAWAKRNKIRFKDEKSKVMLVSRRKITKDNKDIFKPQNTRTSYYN